MKALMQAILMEQSIYNDNIDNFLTNADKTKTTIIYCYKGISSKDAAQHFSDIGFDDVFSMQGGYGEWVDSNDKT